MTVDMKKYRKEGGKSISSVFATKHMQLPEILVAGMEKRVNCEFACFSQASLEVFQFLKLVPDLLVRIHIETGFPHKEDPLCTDGQFEMNSKKTEHVGKDFSPERALE